MQGPSNASKTWICKSIAKNFIWPTYLTTIGGMNSHNFAIQEAPNLTCVVWVEPAVLFQFHFSF